MNTSSVRETFAGPKKQLPEILDEMIALGHLTEDFKHSLGGNGHWPERAFEAVEPG